MFLFCLNLQSPPPEMNPARLKKKSSWPSDNPLLVIKESQLTDSDRSDYDEDENNCDDRNRVETAVLAETLDNVMNRLNNEQNDSDDDDEGDIEMEATMRKNIRRMSVQPLVAPSLKIQLVETSHSDDEIMPSDNHTEFKIPLQNAAMGKKKKATKTKSDPSGAMVKFDYEKGDDRPRSSSEPDIENPPPPSQKNRKMSLHKLGFHRKKSQVKKPKIDDVGGSSDSDNVNSIKHLQEEDYNSKHHKEINDDDTDENNDKLEAGFFSSMRRMSVKIQSKFRKEDEDKSAKLEVIDLSDEKGHMTIKKLSIPELLQLGMFQELFNFPLMR